MTTSQATKGLRKFRVLDLTDDKGFLCGKILGDLGADVIKIEPEGGDSARFLPPFYGDTPDPEQNLLWWAYNTSKRGIVLDIESQCGRSKFLDLVNRSDIVLESFSPGYMAKLGLSYEELCVANPQIIMVSISPFGQEGPYSQFKAPDIVCQAMSGYINLVGDPDRPPLRISVSQSYLHAGNEAAVGALIALWHREKTGVGQYVDISAQECLTWETFSNHQFYYFRGVSPWRAEAGTALTPGFTRESQFMPCKDGYVLFNLTAGAQGRHTRAFLQWMDECGMHDEVLSSYNWEMSRSNGQTTQEERDRVREEMKSLKQRTLPFLATKTMRELFEGAIERGFMLAPLWVTTDILREEHFKMRNFWQTLSYPQMGEKLVHPGITIKMKGNTFRVRRRAPKIGEHNAEILSNIKKLKRYNLTATPISEKDTEVFKGLCVLDLTWVTVGPRSIRYFADHGATVVKIEAPDRPDIGRAVAPHKDEKPEPDRSAWFANYNVNRQGMAIDLTKPAGLKIARQLADWADVIVESYRPGVMNRLGLGYDDIKKTNPGVIYASTSQFGQDGPFSQFGGYGHHAAAICGFDDLTGWPDRTPSGVFWAYTDHIAPQFLVSAIITALFEREKTGIGQYIDQSQNESSLQFLAHQLLDYQVNGRVAVRMGNRDLQMSPHGVFRCQGTDRWCVIAVGSNEEWRVFCRVTGLRELECDQRFGTLQSRKDNEDELERLVEAWTAGLSAEEVMMKLQTAGIAAGVVENAKDQDTDPQFIKRQHYLTYDHPVMGLHQVDALPPKFSKTPARQYRPAPCLGEHNQQVCTEILKMTDEEFVALLADGVFGAV